MDSEKIEKLLAQTLVGDEDSQEAWDAISLLRRDGSRAIFEHAARWCHSDDPLKRARAAAILCQFQRSQGPNSPSEVDQMYRNEVFDVITSMLENEVHPVVLESAISGLGHLGNPDALPGILRHQNHPDPNVRFAVAFALGCFPRDTRSISGLVYLTGDSSSEVRDWAVFGLGVLGDADTAEIRDALLRCLSDPDEDVREEAAVGMGKRHDERLLPVLWTMLSEPNVKVRAAEAAAALLGLEEVPADWTAANYLEALEQKFSSEAINSRHSTSVPRPDHPQ